MDYKYNVAYTWQKRSTCISKKISKLNLVFFFTRENVSPVKKEIPSLSCADLEGKGAGFYPREIQIIQIFIVKLPKICLEPDPPPPHGGQT